MAIEYGMSVHEFWEEDPDLFWAYRFSYFNQIKNRQELFNHNAWLQGAYFYEGISVAFNNAFNKNKLKYPKEPYGIFEKDKSVEMNTKANNVVASIKDRVNQIQNLWKKKEQVALPEGNTEGGEKINE